MTLFCYFQKMCVIFPFFLWGGNLSWKQREICIQKNNLSISTLVCNENWLVKKLLAYWNLQSLLHNFWNLKNCNKLLLTVSQQASRSQGKKPTYSVISLTWATKYNAHYANCFIGRHEATLKTIKQLCGNVPFSTFMFETYSN